MHDLRRCVALYIRITHYIIFSSYRYSLLLPSVKNSRRGYTRSVEKTHISLLSISMNLCYSSSNTRVLWMMGMMVTKAVYSYDDIFFLATVPSILMHARTPTFFQTGPPDKEDHTVLCPNVTQYTHTHTHEYTVGIFPSPAYLSASQPWDSYVISQ